MDVDSKIKQEFPINNGIIKKHTNGLLHFERDKKIEKSSTEGTKTLFNSIANIQGKSKDPMLIDMQGLKEMQMDCRMFLLNKLPDFSTAIAFLIDEDPVTRSQFNLSNSFRKKTIPIEFFHDEKDARKWLSSHL